MSMHLPIDESILFGYLDGVTRELVLNTPWKDFSEWENLPLIKIAADIHGQRFWDDLAICYLGQSTGKQYPENCEDFLAQVEKFSIPPVLTSGILVDNSAYENQGEAISIFRGNDGFIRSQAFAWDEVFRNFDNYIKTCGAFAAYEAVSVIQEFLNLPNIDPSVRDYVAQKGIDYLITLSRIFFSPKSTLSFAAAGLKVPDFKELGMDFQTNTGQPRGR